MTPLRPVSAMKASSISAAVAAFCFIGAIANAQDATTTDSAEGVTLELNKLEKSEKGCRAYIVVSNPTQTTYDTYKLDLVLFQKDGVIGRRLALDLAPVRPDKRTVKLFDLEGANCDDIGSFLVNDVLDCKTPEGTVSDCLPRLKVKSLTKVEISK